MQLKSPAWDTLLIAAIVLVAGLCAQAQQQLRAAEDTEDKIVRISPEDSLDGAPDDFEAEPKTRVVEEPIYWIGIHGRSVESDVLRTHLQLAEEMGIVVEEIFPASPAAKAGLRRHDILLRVNGDAIDNMQTLQSQVRVSKEKPLELTILRLGKQEKIVVVPERRPEGIKEPANALGRFNGRGLEGDMLQQLMEQFGARNIGPNRAFRGGGQRFDLNQMPDGVSVSIQRNNNGPAQITVKQGDKTWRLEGNDQESLKQLPDDVRPFVERMLRGQNGFAPGGAAFDLNEDLEQFLPRGFGRAPDPTQKRIDELEKKLQNLMQRFEAERQ